MKELIYTDEIIEEARALVPDLLVMLQTRTGEAPLVAISALTMAAASIADMYDDEVNVSIQIVKTESEAKWRGACAMSDNDEQNDVKPSCRHLNTEDTLPSPYAGSHSKLRCAECGATRSTLDAPWEYPPFTRMLLALKPDPIEVAPEHLIEFNADVASTLAEQNDVKAAPEHLSKGDE